MAGLCWPILAYLGLTIAAMVRSGWNFEYPLDDVYIHLAMASEITRGGYGVNPGEIASAASSALYPMLLTPFPDTDLQRWLQYRAGEDGVDVADHAQWDAWLGGTYVSCEERMKNRRVIPLIRPE